MRKILLILAVIGIPISAHAADYEQIPAPSEFSWTGLEVGIAGDWVMAGHSDYRIPSAKDLDLDHDLGGPMIGGQIGYNAQVMNWLLLGAEFQGLGSFVDGNKSLYNG